MWGEGCFDRLHKGHVVFFVCGHATSVPCDRILSWNIINSHPLRIKPKSRHTSQSTSIPSKAYVSMTDKMDLMNAFVLAVEATIFEKIFCVGGSLKVHPPIQRKFLGDICCIYLRTNRQVHLKSRPAFLQSSSSPPQVGVSLSHFNDLERGAD